MGCCVFPTAQQLSAELQWTQIRLLASVLAVPAGLGVDFLAHVVPFQCRAWFRTTPTPSLMLPYSPTAAEGLDWLAGMSPGNVEEFTRAQTGEAAYRPLVEQLAQDAVAAAESGGLAVADGYELAESDRSILAAQARSPGHLFRVKATYTGGIDGCIDDGLAFTRPWGFDVTSISVPVSVWYGPEDSLCPRAHTDWLLRHIPGAQARELPGGHVLSGPSLHRLYGWLMQQPAN